MAKQHWLERRAQMLYEHMEHLIEIGDSALQESGRYAFTKPLTAKEQLAMFDNAEARQIVAKRILQEQGAEGIKGYATAMARLAANQSKVQQQSQQKGKVE